MPGHGHATDQTRFVRPLGCLRGYPGFGWGEDGRSSLGHRLLHKSLSRCGVRRQDLADASRGDPGFARQGGEIPVNTAASNTDTGWKARLALGFCAAPQRTVLAQRSRHGPLSVQRPFYPEGPVCHVYLLHPPGGVVGGDELAIDVDVGSDAEALITTPGATKFYRSAAAAALQHQRLRAHAGSSLEWLPQENILFPGADALLETRVDLEADARLALWEIHCLGRPVIGESFDGGRLDSRLAIYRDGQPLLLERLRVCGRTGMGLALMAERPVSATLLLSHASASDRSLAQTLLPVQDDGYTGVTLISDLLVVRYLGHSTDQVKRLFTTVWSALRPGTVGRAPAVPRIWAT